VLAFPPVFAGVQAYFVDGYQRLLEVVVTIFLAVHNHPQVRRVHCQQLD
jgi:hypothetical protein